MKKNIILSFLVATAAVVGAWEVKQYSSADCSGEPTRTIKAGDCAAFTGNATIKYGDAEGLDFVSKKWINIRIPILSLSNK